MKTMFVPLVLLVALTGCTTLWQTTVSLTEVVDSASKEYAKLYNDGHVSPEVDTKVTAAHEVYRKSAGIAASALRAYKASGDLPDYNKAFEEARKAASAFVDLIVPFLTNDKAVEFKTKVQKAEVL